MAIIISSKGKPAIKIERSTYDMKLPALTDGVSPFSALRAVPRHAYLVV